MAPPVRDEAWRDQVRQWLAGQQAAQAVIERERRIWLRSLDSKASLEIYLGLKRCSRQTDEGPSPVLWAMRQALARRHQP